MDWGMKNRMARIIRPDTGRAVWLAVDHGYFLGPTNKLEEPRKTIEPLLPYCDGLFITRGVLRTCVDVGTSTPIILRVSGGASVVGKDLSDEGIVTSIQDAIRLNAAAVGLSIFVGSEYEHQTLMNLSALVNQAQDYGIPVLAVTAVGKELEKRDARYLSLCCRIAAELGASVVKTYYCEGFDRVARGCPVPLVIAGGPKLNTERDALEMTHQAIQQGAIGVDMGRNIWQSEHAVAMIQAIRHIVHDSATPQEGHELFLSLREGALAASRAR
ncbi:MAG: 3-hydroxy-5-phosphonooxypentane-2,4-dione thiolase [Chloroflexi bacterium]|nr:3-hydroxy-5-phosphonooxypentane-2,4-dione thiolase [Chloroflexota bacterium]